MENYSLSKKFLVVFVSLFLQIPFAAIAQEKVNYRTGETDTYRRSSLCLMLVTHQGEEYAKAIEEQFKAMPLPSRYNSLNVDVRVISTTKSKLSDSKLSSVLKDREVAKELVGKWFNRNYQGVMNMNRVHEWGGYNASFADLKRAQDSERGISLLSDEGSELIQNTFVMVCDISYYDRAKTGDWLSGLMMVGAAYLDATAQQQAQKGNSTNASTYSSLATAAAAGSEAAADIAGFSVNVLAHLYRLKWSDKLRDELYGKYWVDETTPAAEAQSRKAAFDGDHKSYELEYLGSYRSRSGKTVSKANNDLNLVIREVCSEAVDKSINNLSKMFPVFKPKTPFYCDGSNIYAYIGTKEGMNNKSKYEVLETKKTKKGIEYNKVAQVAPTNIWNNEGISMTDGNIEKNYKGTQFVRTSGKSDLCDQGYLLREMGKMGYQYRKHTFTAELIVEPLKVSDNEVDDFVKEKGRAEDNFLSFESATRLTMSWFGYRDFNKPSETWTPGLSLGWNINFSPSFSWNVINGKYQSGGGGTKLFGVNTGFIYRFLSFGKGGRKSLFIWPTVGYASLTQECTYNKYWEYVSIGFDRVTKKQTSYNEREKNHGKQSTDVKESGFDYRVKVGMNFSPNIYAAISVSRFTSGVGFAFGVNF